MTWHAQHLPQTWFSLYQMDRRIHWQQGQRALSPGHSSRHSHNFLLQKTSILSRKSRHIIRKVTYGATSQQAAQQKWPHCEQEEASHLYPVWTRSSILLQAYRDVVSVTRPCKGLLVTALFRVSFPLCFPILPLLLLFLSPSAPPPPMLFF